MLAAILGRPNQADQSDKKQSNKNIFGKICETDKLHMYLQPISFAI
jgi:hypothetical protein